MVHFVENPDEGTGDYGPKLKKQLELVSPAARQLFSEMQWVLYLFARDMLRPATKRSDTIRIWEWSGLPLNPDHKFLGECLEGGIGNPGTTFNTLRWREMGFMVRFAKRWVEMPQQARPDFLKAHRAFDFAQWLDRTDESSRRCARNFVCYLLFPDFFERISSGKRKRQILRDVTATVADQPNVQTALPGRNAELFEVDRALYALRKVLEVKYKREDLDFFREPLRQIWDPKAVLSAGDDVVPEEPPMPVLPTATAGQTLPLYSDEDLAADTWTDPARIREWLTLIRRKKQLVFQGPPGTGKTMLAKGLARILTSATYGLVDIVQFHPSYAYEDFIIGIRPDLKAGGQLAFKQEEGRFLKFCREAEAREGAPCVFIIDELNRANLSKVMGELLYSLEYRNESIRLPTGEMFKIPSNVYILGTMNTSDRSIALVDQALRRRFCFANLHPDFDALGRYLKHHKLPVDSLIEVLKTVNQAIGDEGCSLGVSFFMKDAGKLSDTLGVVWRSEVEPLLDEVFFNQPAVRDRFRWAKLMNDELKAWA